VLVVNEYVDCYHKKDDKRNDSRHNQEDIRHGGFMVATTFLSDTGALAESLQYCRLGERFFGSEQRLLELTTRTTTDDLFD
jgi:hypothetical protein